MERTEKTEKRRKRISKTKSSTKRSVNRKTKILITFEPPSKMPVMQNRHISGLCDSFPTKHTIKINSAHSQLFQINTLFHELAHVVLFMISNSQIYNKKVKPVEEKVIMVHKTKKDEEFLADKLGNTAEKEFWCYFRNSRNRNK